MLSKMNGRLLLVGALATAGLVGLAGCSTAPKSEAHRETLSADVVAALSGFRADDPSLRDLMNRSVGYAVFPSVGKAGFIAGGAYGKGEVYEKGSKVGFCTISQGTIGLQVGVQTYDELVLFMTKEKMNEFKTGNFAFSANVSAVAVKPGAAAAADYSKGVVVFVRTQGGLMAEASVGGQKFKFETLAAADKY